MIQMFPFTNLFVEKYFSHLKQSLSLMEGFVSHIPLILLAFQDSRHRSLQIFIDVSIRKFCCRGE